MTTLRQAALAVIARWDLPHRHHQLSTTRIFEDLRTALQEPDIKALQAEGKVLQAKCDAFLANVKLLEVEIKAMTKERDALKEADKATKKPRDRAHDVWQ